MHNTRNTPSTQQPARVGWKIDDWCRAAGLSRALFYKLPTDQRPQSVTIGTRRIIVEPPREYLAKLAAAQMGR